MDVPERLLDQTGSPLERALLQELRCYRARDETRAHTLAALGVIGSSGLAAGGALAWLSGKTWGTKLLLTVSAASVLMGVPAGYFILRQSPTPPAPTVLPTVVAKSPVPQSPSIAPPSPSTSPVLDTPTCPAAPAVTRVSRSGVTTGAGLRAELRALDVVRTYVASGDYLRGLSLLDSYFQNFPHGRLHLEAEVLRIDALARSGRTDAARSSAKEFLRLHPNSVHAARLRSIVGH
jgi:hypothetical protein